MIGRSEVEADAVDLVNEKSGASVAARLVGGRYRRGNFQRSLRRG